MWHHAWGERMIGGENYVSPPHLAWGVFTGMAVTEGMSREELARRVDVPWCKGDLWFVQKVVGVLSE
ncbi:MAG TPA: hypothetical protein VEA69_13530 [Tepidisphaeraceae bacterium]|nr:hypothetical protein [Tepidisphaeraceae bacterium]